MYQYAVSIRSFGDSEETAESYLEALKQTTFTKLEIPFSAICEPNRERDINRRYLRRLMAETNLAIGSVHFPVWTASGFWDPGALDESERKVVVQRYIQLIRENAEFLGPLVTLHAGLEPYQEDHPAILDQSCRTIDELLPIAEEFNLSINVEYLPRTCIGNSCDEILKLSSRYDTGHVGVCMDVNHVESLYKQLPDIIALLAPRIKSFHLSDYDGVQERHWIPGQGIIDWHAVMEAVRKIDHELLLIFETDDPMDGQRDKALFFKELEQTCAFLEGG